MSPFPFPNPIESALSVTRRVTARVTRWRDGEMRRRWCAAGLLLAESQFRRIKGHRAMATLITCSGRAESRWCSHEPWRIERLGFRTRTG